MNLALYNTAVKIFLLISVFVVFGYTAALAHEEGLHGIEEIQEHFPDLSLEDAEYVYQRMVFEGKDTAKIDELTKMVEERLAENGERSSIYTTEVVSVSYTEVSPRNYRVTIGLLNKGKSQSGIKYRLSLKPVDGEMTNQTNVYEKTFDEILSLDTDEELSRELDFVIPDSIGGEFFLAAELGGEHGIVHAIQVADEVIKIEAAPSDIKMPVESCFLSIEGVEGDFNLVQGVDIASDENLILHCTVRNDSADDISLVPQFTTYERNTWGGVVGASDSVTDRVLVVANATSTIKIVLPKATLPQAYDVTVSLLADSKSVIAPVVVHYVVQGDSATIHNVTPDQPSYDMGSVANIELAWSGAADNFAGSRSGQVQREALQAELSVKDVNGNACSDVYTTQLPISTHGVEPVSIPITSACEDVSVLAIIKNTSGTVLAEKTYSFKKAKVADEGIEPSPESVNSPAVAARDEAMFGVIVAASAFILVCVIAILMYRKQKSTTLPVVLIVFGSFGISLLAFAGTFNVFYNIWDVGGQGWSGHSVTVAFTGPSGTYSNSQSVRFISSLTNVSCANIPVRSRITTTIYNSSNNVVQSSTRTNTTGYTASWAASTFTNGTYRGVMTWTDTGCRTYNGNTATYPANRYQDYQCDRNPARSETFYFTVSNSPSGTLSGGNCTIAAGASTCTSRIQWNILNAGSPNLRNTTRSYTYSFSASGNSWETLWYGSNVLAVRNGSTNLATLPLTVGCAAGSSWDGSSCVVPPPVPPPANPASMTATCAAPGNPVNISWPAVAGATHYALRIDYDDLIPPHLVQEDTYVGTSYNSFTPLINTGYKTWIHACNASGCSAGVAYSHFTCYDNPTINLSANPNPVGPNNNSDLTWVVTDADTCTASSNPANWTGSKSSTGGTESVPAGSYTLDCEGPGGTASQTYVINTPAGSISALGCTIGVGDTTCDADVSWSSNHFQTTEVSQGATVFSTDTTNTGVLRPVNPDNRTFTLSDTGSTYSLSTQAVVDLAPGLVWITALSQPELLPIITITPDSSLVRSGNTANLTVNIDADYDLDCTIFDGVSQTFSHTGSPTPVDYSRITRMLKSAQIVTVSCVSPDHSELTGETSTRINVIPTFQEV